jgi:aquaporin Z
MCTNRQGVNMFLLKRLFAEFLGTFWLVLGGCGSAVLAAKFPDLGVGFLGVAFAFGLSVLTMVYAVGHISGGHFNPAVSWGLFVGKRFAFKDLLPYIIIQVIAATAAAYLLYLIASGDAAFNISNGLANNGYGEHSPGGYTLLSCFLAEVTMTFMFIMVILGSTEEGAPRGFAGLSIGLCLTLIHLVTIPITNTSVNPARTMGPALVVGGWPVEQLWFFWVAPLVGATLAGLAYRCLKSD